MSDAGQGPDALWPNGSGPAVDLGGRRLTYAELGALIRAADVGPGTVRAPTTGAVDLLVAFYAARRAQRPVVVADADVRAELPPGTDLVVATSGSAGRPRLVARSARSWWESFAPFTALTGIEASDVVAVTGPLTSTLQLFAAVHALAVGATVTDRAETATAVHGVPTVLVGLRPGPRLRLMVAAGADVPASFVDSARAGSVDLVEYYGATELSFVATGRPPAMLRAFAEVETEIRDGVLWTRSPYLSLGYVGPQDGPYRRDSIGFATVGDLAEEGPDGLRVLGRGDAAVTVGGATVVVEDVERVLRTVPGVGGVAVLGLPHPRFGQILAAVVETADLPAVRAAARTLLSGAARPQLWYVVARLPRTTGGKVARGQVADELRSGRLAPHYSAVMSWSAAMSWADE